MDRDAELGLIDELLGLKRANSAFLDDAVSLSPVSSYADPGHFKREQKTLFTRLPLIVAHASELPEPGSFLRRDLPGLPLLLTRDKDGGVHGFFNVCRHRGARLVDAVSGCKASFSCPYHAWTYANTGELRSIPHERQGFPGLDKKAHGLTALACEEQAGWIWVQPGSAHAVDATGFLDGLETDFDWLGMEGLRIVHADVIECQANWKLIIEGGIEAYHFKVAHRDTIAPFFEDNLSSYALFGPHIRSILPRACLQDHTRAPRNDWAIRECANLLYTVFPFNQFLVQQDHLIWLQLTPVAVDQTVIRLCTMVPSAAAQAQAAAHWQKNHAITLRTLNEDFALGESIQSGFASRANDHLTFGRYEGALDRFARTIAAHMRK